MPRRGRDARAEIEIDFLDAVLAREISVEIQGRGRLRLKIPPGANDGTRVRLAGQGEAGVHGAPAGDLVVTLRVRPHPLFRREGDDLHLDVPVTIPELVLGAKIDVPTPDGSASVSVPVFAPARGCLRQRRRETRADAAISPASRSGASRGRRRATRGGREVGGAALRRSRRTREAPVCDGHYTLRGSPRSWVSIWCSSTSWRGRSSPRRQPADQVRPARSPSM
jgi:hypothetical protein